MCFSPEASFLASGVLGATGTAVLAVSSGKQGALAIIPITFGVQQAFEGYQWLCLRNGSACTDAAYAFLFFALIIWPALIPALAYFLDEKRRPLIRWFVWLGGAISLYFLASLLLHGVSVSVAGESIRYQFYSIISHPLAPLVYVTAVCGPLAISSISFLRWFALAILLSSAIAYTFFTVAFVSVWCFFGAVLSFMIVGYVYAQRRKEAFSRRMVATNQGGY